MGKTIILTGSPTRFGEDHFTEDNGLLAAVKTALADAMAARLGKKVPEGDEMRQMKPRVLMVSAAPDDRGFTEYVLESMTECIRKSGIDPPR